jgi:hypothetical protein
MRPEVAAVVGYLVFAATLLWPAGWALWRGWKSVQRDPTEAGVAEYLRRQMRG